MANQNICKAVIKFYRHNGAFAGKHKIRAREQPTEARGLRGRNSYTGSAARFGAGDYAACTRRSVGESGVAGRRGNDRSSGSVCSGHSSQRQSAVSAAGGLVASAQRCSAAACRRRKRAPQRHAKGASPSCTSACAFSWLESEKRAGQRAHA